MESEKQMTKRKRIGTTFISEREYIAENVEIGEGTIIHAGAIIEEECKIGANCRIGYHAVLRRRTVVGDNSVFSHHSVSEGNNVIGRNTVVHAQCHITEGVKIEDWVFIAPFFCGANTRRIVHGRNFPLEKVGYTIGYGARIGIGVLVAPGIKIGREALVDMGALVTKDVPDYTHVRGVPARPIGEVPENERLTF